MTFSFWEFEITVRSPIVVKHPRCYLILSRFDESVVGCTWDEELVAQGPPSAFRRISHAEFKKSKWALQYDQR